MNSLTDVTSFIQGVLGKEPAEAFDENIEDLIYYIRTAAITGDVDEDDIKLPALGVGEQMIEGRPRGLRP